MSRIKQLAVVMNILQAAWAIYYVLSPWSSIGLSIPPFGVSSPSLLFSGLPLVVLALGVLLLIDAIACRWGNWVPFFAGVVLSAGLLVSGALAYATLGGIPLAAGMILSVIGAITNFLAARSSQKIPEQANPMNLPVFG
jgi:hypothetical protein